MFVAYDQDQFGYYGYFWGQKDGKLPWEMEGGDEREAIEVSTGIPSFQSTHITWAGHSLPIEVVDQRTK